MYSDSLDKIIQTYFVAMTTREFIYKENLYKPKPLKISPLLCRGFVCPPHCAGCCPTFSLDYLPEELLESSPLLSLDERKIKFNRIEYKIFSDLQSDNISHHCKYVDEENGRCVIHGNQPFSCDFELIRIIQHTDHNLLIQKLFGRGWALTRIDGRKGALCELLPPSDFSVSEVVRKLNRLQKWMNYFELSYTYIPEILTLIEKGLYEQVILTS